MNFLKGKKTYIIAGLIGVVTVAAALGYIGDETKITLIGLLGGGGLATLRAGVSK